MPIRRFYLYGVLWLVEISGYQSKISQWFDIKIVTNCISILNLLASDFAFVRRELPKRLMITVDHAWLLHFESSSCDGME